MYSGGSSLTQFMQKVIIIIISFKPMKIHSFLKIPYHPKTFLLFHPGLQSILKVIILFSIRIFLKPKLGLGSFLIFW